VLILPQGLDLRGSAHDVRERGMRSDGPTLVRSRSLRQRSFLQEACAREWLSMRNVGITFGIPILQHHAKSLFQDTVSTLAGHCTAASHSERRRPVRKQPSDLPSAYFGGDLHISIQLNCTKDHV
jgi:hypothetical protein